MQEVQLGSNLEHRQKQAVEQEASHSVQLLNLVVPEVYLVEQQEVQEHLQPLMTLTTSLST